MNRFANFARSRLAAYLPADGNELTVEDTSVFPEGSFTAVIWGKGFASPADDANREIVLATRTEETITAERGRESTAAKDWNTGSLIANVVTAELLNSVSASVSPLRVIANDGSSIDPSDTVVAFSFGEQTSPMVCTLPEAALFRGNMLTLINCGSTFMQYVILNAAENDVIGINGAVSITLGSSCTIRLTVADGIWRVIGTGLFSPHSTQTVFSSGPLNSLGTIAYADASMYPLYLYIQENPAMAGVPSVLMKADDTDNRVSVYSQTGDQFAELKNFGDAVWFMQTGSGGIVKLSTGGSSSGGGYVKISGYYSFENGISSILADTAYGYAYIDLGSPADHQGQSVTVIRTDATIDPVQISKDEVSDYLLSSEGESATFICSGTAWYRTA